jgi:type I restriction enzyme R subunit
VSVRASYESPIGKLSQLIATLNEKFGMNLGDADQIWVEQQKQVVMDDESLKTVALNNDREQYQVVLEKKAEDLILDRHEANGELFSAFFERPGVRAAFLKYLADSYDEFRGKDAS